MDFSTIFLNTLMSSAHSRPLVRAIIVAALGLLYLTNQRQTNKAMGKFTASFGVNVAILKIKDFFALDADT
jgi:hypothetical protein